MSLHHVFAVRTLTIKRSESLFRVRRGAGGNKGDGEGEEEEGEADQK